MPVPLGPGAAVSVDVEEWYHNCWVPEYVHPSRRGDLPEELDRLLPQLLERFERLAVRGTFFVLGEVARRLPEAVRAVARAGHEVACHGELHLRANDRSPAAFRRDIATAKARLEDLVGEEVRGFRAPEWSLRSLANPRLRIVADCGFRYDSSLSPAAGAGGRANPRRPAWIEWADGATLIEFPPLVWGGALRLPAGGWCGRLAGFRALAGPIARAASAGRLPLLVVHPWELVDRPVPGLLTGFARFLHEAGRVGFAQEFDRIAHGAETSLTLGERWAALPASTSRAAREAARATSARFAPRAVESAL